MLRRFALVALVVAVGSSLFVAPAQARPAQAPAHYYLALGDSLAWGSQPVQPVDRAEGYTFQLHAALQQRDPALAIENIACPGETTQSMLVGGVCDYGAAGAQLAAAEAFLRAHRGSVKLVTLDIGGNDLNACVVNGAIDQTCVYPALVRVAVNLAKVTLRLRAAAPGVRMAAMTYYDPYLAAYLLGPAGQALARQSLQVIGQLNGLLSAVYMLTGFRVADVAGAFSSNDWTTQVPLPGVGTVPLNVARICQWTWMCAPAPQGPDIHGNRAGYAVIAGAFLPVVR